MGGIKNCGENVIRVGKNVTRVGKNTTNCRKKVEIGGKIKCMMSGCLTAAVLDLTCEMGFYHHSQSVIL